MNRNNLNNDIAQTDTSEQQYDFEKDKYGQQVGKGIHETKQF